MQQTKNWNKQIDLCSTTQAEGNLNTRRRTSQGREPRGHFVGIKEGTQDHSMILLWRILPLINFANLTYFNSDNKGSIHKPYREIYQKDDTGWRIQIKIISKYFN